MKKIMNFSLTMFAQVLSWLRMKTNPIKTQKKFKLITYEHEAMKDPHGPKPNPNAKLTKMDRPSGPTKFLKDMNIDPE